MVKEQKQENKLILESSLQSFFFDQLLELNKKSQAPLPNETIYYSSLVMDRFGDAGQYFEVIDGKVREKILGVKLLESSHQNKTEQRRSLKDIGDTALFVCGFFSDSLNNKIVDTKYYQEVGQIAYRRLNIHVPDAYQMDSFYRVLSKSFEKLSLMMSLVSEQTFKNSQENNPYLLMIAKSIKAS